MNREPIHIKDNIDNYKVFYDYENTDDIYLLKNEIADRLNDFENVEAYKLVSNGKYKNTSSFRLDKKYVFSIPVNRLIYGVTIDKHSVLF